MMFDMNNELWEKAAAFHGHKCPGLAIGYRACEALIEKFNLTGRSEDEKLVCITENDACGVDAIQTILGCSFGKGNLIYRGTGKHVYSFYNRTTGQKIRMYFKARNSDNLARHEWQKRILEMPIEDLFEFSVPAFEPPEKARRFKTVYCEICGEGAPEHKMRLQDGKIVCLDCFKSYDRGW